jgi:hypothetical protein
MNAQKLSITFVVLLVMGVCPGFYVQGQQNSSKSQSYIFVSPNTRENLTLEEAEAGLNSAEEMHLIKEERDVACRLRRTLTIQKAVGSWSDGAEHSTVITGSMGQPSLRYAGSWLGKFANQKAILYFHPSNKGAGRIYVLYLRPKMSEIAAIANKLEADGIANRTILPRRNRVIVIVVDLKNELRTKITSAARRLRGRLAASKGDGEFIGDDDRDKARQVFGAEIAGYEKKYPNVKAACRVKLRSAK